MTIWIYDDNFRDSTGSRQAWHWVSDADVANYMREAPPKICEIQKIFRPTDNSILQISGLATAVAISQDPRAQSLFRYGDSIRQQLLVTRLQDLCVDGACPPEDAKATL